MKKIILIFTIISYVFIISCKPKNNNFSIVKEYFPVSTKNNISFTGSSFFEYTADKPYRVQEEIITDEESIRYILKFEDQIFEWVLNESNFIAEKDSSSAFIIIGKNVYKRKTKDIFINPEFENISGIYREYDTLDQTKIRLELDDHSYPYKIYMSISGEDLIIHKSYSFKTETDEHYYFSKKRGLYKIEMLYNMVILNRI